jgi:hypothetical protein
MKARMIINGPNLKDKVLDHLPFVGHGTKTIKALMAEIPVERRQEINRACRTLHKFGYVNCQVTRIKSGNQMRQIYVWWRTA